MRGIIGVRLQTPTISNATRNSLANFSTSSGFGGGSGSGGGRGRGGSGLGGPFGFNESTPGKPNFGDPKSEEPELPSPPPPVSGRGHGRGRPAPPSGMPSFSSFMASIKQPSAGRGRGGPLPSHTQQDSKQQPDSEPKKPVFFKREEDDDYVGVGAGAGASSDVSPPKAPIFSSIDGESDQKNLPGGIVGVLSGIGRGKPKQQPDQRTQVSQENRHIRAQRAPGSGGGGGVRGGDGRAPAAAAPSDSVPKRQPKQRVDAVNDARRILSQRDNEDVAGRGRPGFSRGRGGGRGRGGFRVRDMEERGDRDKDEEDSDSGLFLGEHADGERFAKKVGPDIMNQLTVGFEEMANNVFPSPLEEEYLEAFDTNCAIEFEPEYLMGEFDQNPDIDEKEPIPLRDALEKMKPFLMAYEGIQSQEEWEEIMEETMARVPLLKKIVDHYSGPDRVTAKKQNEELERVARTLPKSAPSSVKQFTNRAVISLQSNPGWGFDKKCHFMDKLVWEVSQHYK